MALCRNKAQGVHLDVTWFSMQKMQTHNKTATLGNPPKIPHGFAEFYVTTNLLVLFYFCLVIKKSHIKYNVESSYDDLDLSKDIL